MNQHASKFLFVCTVLGCSSLFAQQPESPLVRSWASYQQQRLETPFGVEWINVSPLTNSARVEAVQLVPSQPGLIYAAFGSGGLWKSTNNGMTWQSIFQDQASYGIGDVAIAPSNPKVLYLGTGESLKKARNFTIPGTGVYRSDDAGENWRPSGLNDSWHIGEIAVHPTNPDCALVAVLGHFWSANPNRGLYRTEDGGQTWQHVLQISDRVGANDVVWGQDDPRTVYASTWENHPNVSGAGSAIYRSHDAGVSWEKCEQGLPEGESVGRIGLAVSHSNSRRVYALVDERNKIADGAAANLYRSDDGGVSWSRTHEESLPIFSRIGWYFADVYVNPQDDAEVFALGVRVAHSTDGGKSFELLGGQVHHITPSAATGMHLDHCEMWINPTNSAHLVLGNDGGLYQSYDRGQSWLHFNNIPTGEFYDIEVDQTPDYTIYAGAQDDATVFGKAQELARSRIEPWKYLWIDPWNGGDGCITQVDPANPNRVYFSAQEGVFRRKDMLTNQSQPIPARLPEGHGGELRFNFVGPMTLSPHNPDTLYLAGNYVFESSNRGDEWTVISEDISQSAHQDRQSVAAGTICESPRVRGLLYVGTDKGALWVKEPQGAWDERSAEIPLGYIRNICPSRFVDSRVYMTVTGLNYDDLETHVHCSEDRGRTWRSIAGVLHDEPANVIAEDPIFSDILYLGTFRGVYISMDRGKSWSLLGRNLPACSISDIEFHLQSRDMLVATHGRGVFKLNLHPIHDIYTQRIAEGSDNYLCAIPSAVLPARSDTRVGLNFRPLEKTTITYWLDEPNTVELRVLDAQEEPLVEFQLESQRGMNQLRWDLSTERVDSLEPYFVEYQKFLSPGQYWIELKPQPASTGTTGQLLRQKLTITRQAK